MTTLTIVNVDHVLHVGNVGKGDKVDKLIFFDNKNINYINKQSWQVDIFDNENINYISAVCTEWIDACTQAR